MNITVVQINVWQLLCWHFLAAQSELYVPLFCYHDNLMLVENEDTFNICTRFEASSGQLEEYIVNDIVSDSQTFCNWL